MLESNHLFKTNKKNFTKKQKVFKKIFILNFFPNKTHLLSWLDTLLLGECASPLTVAVAADVVIHSAESSALTSSVDLVDAIVLQNFGKV